LSIHKKENGKGSFNDGTRESLIKGREERMAKRSNARPVKFEVYGQEMIEKDVKAAGNSGRVYLPPDWIDKRVKIIRIN